MYFTGTVFLAVRILVVSVKAFIGSSKKRTRLPAAPYGLLRYSCIKPLVVVCHISSPPHTLAVFPFYLPHDFSPSPCPRPWHVGKSFPLGRNASYHH